MYVIGYNYHHCKQKHSTFSKAQTEKRVFAKSDSPLILYSYSIKWGCSSFRFRVLIFKLDFVMFFTHIFNFFKLHDRTLNWRTPSSTAADPRLKTLVVEVITYNGAICNWTGFLSLKLCFNIFCRTEGGAGEEAACFCSASFYGVLFLNMYLLSQILHLTVCFSAVEMQHHIMLCFLSAILSV